MIHILSPQERETVILFNEGDTIATIYTYNRAWQNNLKKKVVEHPDTFKLLSSQNGVMEFECPKKYISPPRSPREGRKLTDEEKQARADNLAEWRKRKSTVKIANNNNE